MSPLKGTVIKTGAVLTVRLQSRAVVDIPYRNDLLLGDTCYVLYDFTRMQVADIWSEDEYNEYEDVSGGEFLLPLPPGSEEPHEIAVDPNVFLDVSL